MYANKMAIAIKTNGRVLREHKDTVYLPFGAHYEIGLKNLNTVRAMVNIFIDGENVVPGGLVINAGQECNLERSIKNNNLNVGNKFKFIERTDGIEQHRGVKLEDGVVRVEYQFEKVYTRHPAQWYGSGYYNSDYSATSDCFIGATLSSSSPFRSAGTSSMTDSTYIGSAICSGQAMQMSNQVAAVNNVSVPASETGITVAGGKSEQKFHLASWFATETEKYNIILKLLGETPDNKAVRNPVTVKAKQKCNSCGKINKATSHYCSECGTGLEIFA